MSDGAKTRALGFSLYLLCAGGRAGHCEKARQGPFNGQVKNSAALLPPSSPLAERAVIQADKQGEMK